MFGFWFWFVMCLPAVFFFTLAIIKFISARRHEANEVITQNAKPKIGAEVSSRFYDEVKQYCRKHHMTISDLIREAVRVYMDTYR